jgi:hypothetical protein
MEISRRRRWSKALGLLSRRQRFVVKRVFGDRIRRSVGRLITFVVWRARSANAAACRRRDGKAN